MILWTGPALPLIALVWPLTLAALTALPRLRGLEVRLLTLAPLPALWLVATGSEAVTTAPGLLLGVTLGLDETRRLLLGMTAALWLIAGLAAQPMAARPHMAIFSGFWCLTHAGNLGVFLARDAVTFYVAFAAVSLAAWFLVVHDRSETALRAGRVYIAIAIAGEVALLLGLLIGVAAAGDTDIGEVGAALGTSRAGPIAVALLVVGFGIKAGLVPLHVWLPLAHPAAPVPASAVLSGTIVKAGLFGLILFLPGAHPSVILMALGLAGAFGAALWGLTQSNPKAVLAYSTISQMGLMVMFVAAGGAARDMAPFYALHHGFAKGALFLLVGVMLTAGERRHRALCLACAVAVAASVAGFPLSGGALAKAAVKPGLSDTAVLVLGLGSVTTSLILIWFLRRLWLLPVPDKPSPRSSHGLVAAMLSGGLALAAPWFLWTAWTGRDATYAIAAGPLLDALWPVAVALPIGAALLRWTLPVFPPGDLLLLRPDWRPRSVALLPETPPVRADDRLPRAITKAVDRAERRLLRWSLNGACLSILLLVVFVLLM